MSTQQKAPTVATVGASKTALLTGLDSTPPNPNTQAARLLDALQTGQKIDPLTAWQDLGIYRLSGVIYTLKNEHGVMIKTETARAYNRFGEKCHFACYSLQRDEVAQ